MTSKYGAKQERSYSSIKKCPSDRKQPLYPPAQSATEDYLTPVNTKSEDQLTEKQNDKEHLYQSLILPLPQTQDGYVKFTSSVSLPEGTLDPPPPIPPKPDPVPCTLAPSSLQLESSLRQRSESIYGNNPQQL